MTRSCGRNPAAAWTHASLTLALAVSMAFPLMAQDLATSPTVDFWLDTGARPFILTSQSAVNSFASHPVTFREGETVMAIAPDATVRNLTKNALSAGSVPFAPTSDGLWRLKNSNGAEVLVGVSWGIFGEGWSHDFSLDSPFKLHTLGKGPDRGGYASSFPDVAYSGDHWRGDSSADSTLTFFAPDGKNTTVNLDGTGALPFRFRPLGRWTLWLALEDGSEQEAAIDVFGESSILILR